MCVCMIAKPFENAQMWIAETFAFSGPSRVAGATLGSR
jgi:hypothetical protein